MASKRMERPDELLQAASELRKGGQDGSGKKPKLALPLLQAVANAANSSDVVPRANSTAAHVELGHMYLRGEGTRADAAAAVRHYQRAADEGNAEAQHALGVLYSTGFGVERDPALAAAYLHFASEAGNVGAQLAMGYRHLLGVGAPKQCFKALLYYRPVAEKVVAQAQATKGASGTLEKVRLTVDNPRGTMKRGADDDVLQYYEQSAAKGSVDAQLTLGHLHYHGARGLPADAAKAFAYYSKAASAGEPAAFAHLGNMYAQGVGTDQDNATALEYFRRGAARDHPPSQNGLGFMYMHGHGVARDFKKALEYFKTAAERGNAEAQFNLGAMYIGGMGVRKAYDKALHYFTLSAHQGHTLALYNLGQMHLNGLGAPKSCPVGTQFLKAVAERGAWASLLEEAQAHLDSTSALSSSSSPSAAAKATALHLYSHLAEGGFELAQANVAFLLDQQHVHDPATPLAGVRGDSLAERALHMYRQAAAQGNTEAEVKLGDYAFYGHGTEVDLEAAVAHYRTAADGRSAQATFNLAYMYAHGLGLTRDYHLAKRHYDIAGETSAEAWAPVQLALLELRFLTWWEAHVGGGGSRGGGGEGGGGGGGDGPYEALGAAFGPALGWVGPVLGSLAELEGDTLLIMALCVALGVVLVIRQRQQLTQ